MEGNTRMNEPHFQNSSQENVKQITKRLQEIKQLCLKMVNWRGEEFMGREK